MKRPFLILLIVLFAGLLGALVWIGHERGSGKAQNIPAQVVEVGTHRGAVRQGEVPLVISSGRSRATQAVSGGGSLEMPLDAKTVDVQPWVGMPALDDVLAALAQGDHAALASMRQALLTGDAAAFAVLEALFANGSHQGERFAMEILARIGTQQAAILAMGHVLTRPGAVDAGWSRLAKVAGAMLDGSMVDLVAGLLKEATGEARLRLLALLQHVQQEEALFRMLLAAGEQGDAALMETTVAALFRAGKPGAVELLKDLMVTQSDPHIVAMAATGLAERGTGDAVQFLAEAGNGDDWMAESARWALAQVSSAYGQNALIEIANGHDYDADVRLAALHALGHGGTSANVQRALRNLTLTADAPTIRIAAGEQLEIQTRPDVTPSGTRINGIETWF